MVRALRDMGFDSDLYRHDHEYVYFLGPDDARMGFWLPQHEPFSYVSIIEQLQTGVSESDDRWAEPVPRCPGHEHPVSPDERDGELWWICPASGARVARIGELPR